jgi:hypothetical protein
MFEEEYYKIGTQCRYRWEQHEYSLTSIKGSTAKQELLGKGRTASALLRELTRVKRMPDMYKSITMGGDKFPGQGMLLFNAGLAMANAKEQALSRDENEVVMADPS